jgi:hypothetical protein
MPSFQMELSSQMLRYDRVTFSHSRTEVLVFPPQNAVIYWLLEDTNLKIFGS